VRVEQPLMHFDLGGGTALRAAWSFSRPGVFFVQTEANELVIWCAPMHARLSSQYVQGSVRVTARGYARELDKKAGPIS
jgi:hypothetical protein